MIFNSHTQWTEEGSVGDEFPVRGVRLSLREWEELTLSPPLDHISLSPARINDFIDFHNNLFKGIVVCIRKSSDSYRNKYAYLTHVGYRGEDRYRAHKLIPCHGGAKTIFIPRPQCAIAHGPQKELFEKQVQEEHDNAEVISHTDLNIHYVNDHWILQQIGKPEHIVSRTI